MVDKNNLIDGTISVEDAVAASEGASYNFQSDYPNSEIVYVYGEGYKIAVQQGNYTYFMDLPKDFVFNIIKDSSISLFASFNRRIIGNESCLYSVGVFKGPSE